MGMSNMRELAMVKPGRLPSTYSYVVLTARGRQEGCLRSLPRGACFLTMAKIVRISGQFKMAEATVTTKGQITIPVEIRNALGLQPGERVVFTQLDDGTTIMRAKSRSIVELKGFLKSEKRKKRKVAVKNMNIGAS